MSVTRGPLFCVAECFPFACKVACTHEDLLIIFRKDKAQCPGQFGLFCCLVQQHCWSNGENTAASVFLQGVIRPDICILSSGDYLFCRGIDLSDTFPMMFGSFLLFVPIGDIFINVCGAIWILDINMGCHCHNHFLCIIYILNHTFYTQVCKEKSGRKFSIYAVLIAITIQHVYNFLGRLGYICWTVFWYFSLP